MAWIPLDIPNRSDADVPVSGKRVLITDGRTVGIASFSGSAKGRHWLIEGTNVDGAPVAWSPLPDADPDSW